MPEQGQEQQSVKPAAMNLIPGLSPFEGLSGYLRVGQAQKSPAFHTFMTASAEAQRRRKMHPLLRQAGFKKRPRSELGFQTDLGGL